MSVVVITGASRGIGAATARLAAERGHDVCVNFRANEAAAEAVVDEVRAAGRRAIAVRADVASELDIVRLFETVDAALGTIAGLVNNAGILDQPMGRAGHAIEVARAILWLLSDEASYTTGTFIDVAGGR
ncbi:MAG TPA: SDR family oxidoreductase [Myxococcales bacterium]|nr:SDR family oxidoreductase [Myxococcales bacterium]